MVNLVKKESRRVKQLGLTEEKISKLEGKWKEIIQNAAFRREEIWSLPTQQPRLCTTLWSRASARATRWPRTRAHWATAVSLTEHTKSVWDRIWEVLGFASYKQSALGLQRSPRTSRLSSSRNEWGCTSVTWRSKRSWAMSWLPWKQLPRTEPPASPLCA